jgi:hypothetical protein
MVYKVYSLYIIIMKINQFLQVHYIKTKCEFHELSESEIKRQFY